MPQANIDSFIFCCKNLGFIEVQPNRKLMLLRRCNALAKLCCVCYHDNSLLLYLLCLSTCYSQKGKWIKVDDVLWNRCSTNKAFNFKWLKNVIGTLIGITGYQLLKKSGFSPNLSGFLTKRVRQVLWISNWISITRIVGFYLGFFRILPDIWKKKN